MGTEIHAIYLPAPAADSSLREPLCSREQDEGPRKEAIDKWVFGADQDNRSSQQRPERDRQEQHVRLYSLKQPCA